MTILYLEVRHCKWNISFTWGKKKQTLTCDTVHGVYNICEEICLKVIFTIICKNKTRFGDSEACPFLIINNVCCWLPSLIDSKIWAWKLAFQVLFCWSCITLCITYDCGSSCRISFSFMPFVFVSKLVTQKKSLFLYQKKTTNKHRNSCCSGELDQSSCAELVLKMRVTCYLIMRKQTVSHTVK